MMPNPWYKTIANWCKKRGKYTVILDRESKQPYLERYYLHPRWLTLGLFRVVIHKFWKSDDDTAYHDHPWLFWGSKLLEGDYIEHTPEGSFRRTPGKVRWHNGWDMHQIELDKDEAGNEKAVWTLFIMGVKVRNWGFIGDKTNWKWIKWDIFLQNKKKHTDVDIPVLSIDNSTTLRVD